MNNRPHSANQADLSPSSLRQRLDDLPINRKTNLIPWFSFGGLILFMGVGSLILQGTLQHQLAAQTDSKLEVKSKIIRLSGVQLNGNLAALEATIAAVTEEQGYSAAYVVQEDGSITLASSSANMAGVISSGVTLPDQQILEQAISNQGTVVHQKTKIEGQTYALAAQTIDNGKGQPRAILVHGTSVKPINQILQSNLLAQSA
ncbi:MAG: hypothetical protein RLZZ04_4131, partial [Cyanobacteriota bacterium]